MWMELIRSVKTMLIDKVNELKPYLLKSTTLVSRIPVVLLDAMEVSPQMELQDVDDVLTVVWLILQELPSEERPSIQPYIPILLKFIQRFKENHRVLEKRVQCLTIEECIDSKTLPCLDNQTCLSIAEKFPSNAVISICIGSILTNVDVMNGFICSEDLQKIIDISLNMLLCTLDSTHLGTANRKTLSSSLDARCKDIVNLLDMFSLNPYHEKHILLSRQDIAWLSWFEKLWKIVLKVSVLDSSEGVNEKSILVTKQDLSILVESAVDCYLI
jgi:hypothetical protein